LSGKKQTADFIKSIATRRTRMKMPSHIENSMLAPCGINCMVCYKHCHSKKICLGCLNHDHGKSTRCQNCCIKACAISKGHTYCYECSAFPCKQIKNLDKSYIKRYQVSLVENGHMAKALGVEAFMAFDRERWTCPNCGGIISLHDGECSECLKKR
jgi:hypothetical protein